MTLPLNPHLRATDLPPVMEARRWIEGKSFPADRPLINVSQAAPVEIPPMPLRAAMAEAALHNVDAHLYGAVLGNAALRAAIAARFSAAYQGQITAAHVAVTQGCNQAFCAAMAALAGPGDAVILPTPWYFNHKMWLDMAGVTTLALDTGPSLMPSPAAAEALITPRTRAIVLVTPNNPGGVEYPPALMREFRDLARKHGLALVVDETYRDFDSRQSGDQAAHDLFQSADWDETLVQLYSFSKAYRMTGHRVGALIAAPRLMVEIEKFLDTMAICPNQLGQIGALWGLEHLGEWLGGERAEILARRDAMMTGFAGLPGWKLLGCGAYFAYVEHPFPVSSTALCQQLVEDCAILMLPGSMFQPPGSAAGLRQLRIAFANIDVAGIAEMFRRLRAFPGPAASGASGQPNSAAAQSGPGANAVTTTS